MGAPDITMKVSANVVNPSCTIDAPAVHNLGYMKRNKYPTDTKEYPPFDMKVACQSPVKTSLTATIIKGQLSTRFRRHVSMVMLDGMINHDVNLSLRSIGYKTGTIDYIDYDSSTSFCQGDDNRACKIIPSVVVEPNAKLGTVNAIIRFNAQYD